MTRLPIRPNLFDGRWRVHYFCAKCDREVTWYRSMHSRACCPYCAHTVEGTVMDTVMRPMRWIPAEREWWQFWRSHKGEFVGKTIEKLTICLLAMILLSACGQLPPTPTPDQMIAGACDNLANEICLPLSEGVLLKGEVFYRCKVKEIRACLEEE